MTEPHLLLALQHADGLFPSGGFAFSQGLEAAAALADRLGRFDLDGFIAAQIRFRWATADRVALVRAFRLDGDLDRIAALDLEVEASTPMEGLRLGSRRNGTALLTAHERLRTPGAAAYRARVRQGTACGHLAVVQGLVWHAIGLDEVAAVAIGGYSAAASLATAAVRLGLVGAIEAQAALGRALATVADASALPVAADEPLGSFVTLADIAVALHGASGQRLFSN